jgi:hypothetical protein
MRKRFDSSRKIKIKKPMTTKKKVGLIIGIVAGVLALAAGGFLIWKMFFSSNPIVPPPEPEPVRYFSPLTGVETTEVNTKRPVTAVMIENSPEARPQSGLQQAGVVFEAVAEGGITRFIVLYQEAQPELIGPVRSVRPYYIEWASAFSPGVAHEGGSDDALAMIRSGNYGVDLDHFFDHAEEYYWRATDRWAPHNMYTDAVHLDALMTSKGKTSSQFTPWPRQDGKRIIPPGSAEGVDENTIDINVYANSIIMPVSSGTFRVSYTYDPETNSYVRYQGGEAHLDRELGRIAPDTVIALMVNMRLGWDGLHNEITTTGTGTAYIFQNGVMIEAIWSKPTATSQIEFKDIHGNEVELNRGQTWVTAVPNGNTVTWQ